MIWATGMLALAAVLPALAVAYLVLLTLSSVAGREVRPAADQLRIAAVVPAHDEAAGIGRTIQSLRSVEWPPALLRVMVVADNCTDDTAAKAGEAGAQVMVRENPELRGKGYALQFAFERLLAEGWAQAVVVVDADTLVSANLMRALAGRIELGARAVQADYAVQNPNDSWRTRLIAIALAMFHVLRSRGRETLGLSCGLRGNGMCFAAEVLRDVPHQAFSVVEDVEYGIRLGEAGHRVWYAGEAHVFGEMVSGEKASRSQRQRWEGGRETMARERGPGLLAKAVTTRSPLLFDLAMDILIPPLSTLVVAVAMGFGASLALVCWGAHSAIPLGLWSFSLAGIGVYVFRGWWLSSTGARGLLDLAYAPFYIGWKLVLAVTSRNKNKGDWVRTTRESETH